MSHSNPVQSVLRSLDVLDVVGQAERGLSLHEICEVVGLKPSTAYNLLRTLMARNYIIRTPPPVRYQLGAAVFRLADEVTRHDLVVRAGETLRRLYARIIDELGQHLTPDDEVDVGLVQSVGGEVRVLLRIRNDRPTVVVRPMVSIHPYRSASSLVYQAYWTREQRAAYRRAHPFNEHGIQFWKRETDLNMYLHQIRLQKYADPPLYGEGAFHLSVPIFGRGQVLAGTIGIEVWKRLNKLQRFRLTRLTTEAACELTSSAEGTTSRGPR